MKNMRPITLRRDVKPRGSVALFLFFSLLGLGLVSVVVAGLQFGDPYGLTQALIYVSAGVGACFGAAYLSLPTRMWYSRFWNAFYKDVSLGMVTMCLVLALMAPSKKIPNWVETNTMPLTMAYTRHLQTLPSDDEIDLMTRVLYGEARGETPEGQVNIVHTIINRAEDRKKRFGPTYSEVMIRPFAFSCMNADDPNYKKLLELDKKSLTYKKLHAIVVKTINERLNGGIDPTQNSTHYHNLKVDPKWNMAADGMIRIGNHKFWRGVD